MKSFITSTIFSTLALFAAGLFLFGPQASVDVNAQISCNDPNRNAAQSSYCLSNSQDPNNPFRNGCPPGYTVSEGTEISTIRTCRRNDVNPGNYSQPQDFDCGGSGATAVFQILPYCNLFDLLNALQSFLLSLAVPLAVLVIMWGGYQYFLSSVDNKANGMRTIQAGVIGLAIALIAPYIVTIVSNTITNEGIDAGAITEAITTLYEVLRNLAAVVATLVIIWGGYQYFFGGFDGKTDGLKTIRSGVIGLAVILLASLIVGLVSGLSNAQTLAEVPTVIGEAITPLLTTITGFLTLLAGTVSVLVIIWGGYQYFFSALSSGKRDGMENIQRGIIGLVVTILAGPIVSIIQSTIGVGQENQLSLQPGSIIFVFQQLITNFLIPISSVITVFFLILGAYQWMTAGGDVGKVKKGQDNIRNAIIGLIIVLLATTISQLIIFFINPTDYVDPGTSTPTPSTPTPSQSTSTTSRPILN